MTLGTCHTDPFIFLSTFFSQYPMSIWRYMDMAVWTCSSDSMRLPVHP